MSKIDNWYCYIINSNNPNYKNKSYNGSTNNLVKRLRQHNGEISGGAFRTKIGQPWKYYCVLKGLPNHINTLSCEWKIRHPDNKRKKDKKYLGVCGRIIGLNEILKLEKWTNQCNILNKDMNLELFILKKYSCFIDINEIPSNIKINIVDNIDPTSL